MQIYAVPGSKQSQEKVTTLGFTGNVGICGEHFKADSFFPSSAAPDQISRKRLRPTAVPTIFSCRAVVKERPSGSERKKTAAEHVALFEIAIGLKETDPRSFCNFLRGLRPRVSLI